MVYVATWSTEIVSFDINTFEETARYRAENQNRFHHIQLTNDDTILIASDYSPQICFFDVSDRNQVSLTHTWSNPIVGLACSFHPDPEDTQLIIGSWWFDFRRNYTTDVVIYDLNTF